MKGTSTNLKNHRAGIATNLAQCLRVQLKNGSILRFTNHDQNIVISGYASPHSDLNGTYVAKEGFFSAAVQTTLGLSVDNTELEGPQATPALIEADLRSGAWDRAAMILFEVNWDDLSMGPDYLRVGHIGEVEVENGKFKAEFRGLAQEYTKSLCELTSPGCRANLGDARCNANLASFTVTGTLTSVNADNQTVYDTSRAESGPSAGVAIVNISNANPAVVTLMDGSLNLVNGETITIAGVVGMEVLNVVTVALNPVNNTFELGVDTTDIGVYGAYTSGGTVTPFASGTNGFFDGGKITFSSGLNDGISMEIKSYVPGQITLAEPLPFAAAAGDEYTAIAGCDKSLQTCRDRFNNIENFRGEPYIRGLDQLLQVGRHV